MPVAEVVPTHGVRAHGAFKPENQTPVSYNGEDASGLWYSPWRRERDEDYAEVIVCRTGHRGRRRVPYEAVFVLRLQMRANSARKNSYTGKDGSKRD